MSESPFKVGDRVVCVDASWTLLTKRGVYAVVDTSIQNGRPFIAVDADDRLCRYAAYRFIHEQDAPCPSRADDYPESSEDYEHNKPHHVIVWGAASLLIWVAFFAGLWCGWMWL